MSATMLEQGIDEAIDLDNVTPHEGLRHRACNACYPRYLADGEAFTGICGRRAVATGRPSYDAPPNACRDCEGLSFGPCQGCGA